MKLVIEIIGYEDNAPHIHIHSKEKLELLSVRDGLKSDLKSAQIKVDDSRMNTFDGLEALSLEELAQPDSHIPKFWHDKRGMVERGLLAVDTYSDGKYGYHFVSWKALAEKLFDVASAGTFQRVECFAQHQLVSDTFVYNLGAAFSFKTD